MYRTGVFNLLSSRTNLHLSYNPVGRSHCRLQNHHGYIKHHHRGMGAASFSNPCIASPTSQLILQPFRRFTYSTSQLILQPFRCFTYVIGTSPTSQLILQPFRRSSYITAHSTTLPPLHLRHSSFYNPSFASPTS